MNGDSHKNLKTYDHNGNDDGSTNTFEIILFSRLFSMVKNSNGRLLRLATDYYDDDDGDGDDDDTSHFFLFFFSSSSVSHSHPVNVSGCR